MVQETAQLPDALGELEGSKALSGLGELICLGTRQYRCFRNNADSLLPLVKHAIGLIFMPHSVANEINKIASHVFSVPITGLGATPF